MNAYWWYVKLSLVLVVLLAGCRKSEDVLFRVSLQQAIDHPQPVQQKDWMDSIRYVPLETTDSCYVGEIYKIVYQSGMYYIRDLSGNLFVFTEEGKFVRKIGKQGRGPEEYTFLCDFTVDPENGDVYLVSAGEIVVYGVDGRFVRRTKISSELQVVTFDAVGRLVFIAPVFSGRPGNFHLLNICDRQGRMVRQISGDYVKGELTYFNWIQEKDGKIYFKQEFSDTLCYMDTEMDIHPYALIDVKNYAFKPEMFSMGKMEQWPKYYRLDGAFDFKNSLVLNIQQGLIGKELSTCFFNKKNGTTCLGKRSPGYDGFLMEGLNYCPRALYGNHLICTLSASDICENGNIQDDDLRRIAAQLNENANPVLAVCTMK